MSETPLRGDTATIEEVAAVDQLVPPPASRGRVLARIAVASVVLAVALSGLVLPRPGSPRSTGYAWTTDPTADTQLFQFNLLNRGLAPLTVTGIDAVPGLELASVGTVSDTGVAGQMPVSVAGRSTVTLSTTWRVVDCSLIDDTVDAVPVRARSAIGLGRTTLVEMDAFMGAVLPEMEGMNSPGTELGWVGTIAAPICHPEAIETR